MADSRWSRLIPTRRRVVTYVAVLLGLLLVRLALDIWAGYHVRSVSARLILVYGGLDLASLSPPAVKPGENRARILSAAAALTERDARGRGELTAALFGTLAKDPAKRQAILRQAVANNRLALQVLDGVESRPKANWEITYRDGTRMRMPSLMEIRDLSDVNVAAGLLDLADENADEAARHARLGLLLAGSMAQEPNLLVQLIRIAVARAQCRLLRDTLTEGAPSAAALHALAPPLEEELRQRPVVVGLIGELKYRNNVFEGIERGGKPWTGAGEESFTGSAMLAWVLRPAVRVAHARVLEQDDRTIEYARLEPFAREARNLRPPSEKPQPWWWRRFVDVFTAGFERAIRWGDEHRALTTLAATAVALRRCRLDRGSYPTNLDALVPAFLPAVPVDPFTGRPPEYKLAGAGFEIRVKAPPEAVPVELFDWKVPR